MTWTEILNQINDNYFNQQTHETLEKSKLLGYLDNETIKNKWLGNNPCTSDQIKNLELKLGVTIPTSFKDFLLVSNGFKNIAPMVGNLNPIERIDWVKNTEQEWLEIISKFNYPVSDEKYFDYSENQDSAYFRNEYLKDCLKISEWEDGVIILLNPNVKYDSEWEVIEYGTWYPGASRFKSFFDYMIAKKNCDVTLWN